MPALQKILSSFDQSIDKVPFKWLQAPINEDGVALSRTVYLMTLLRKLTGSTPLNEMSIEKARKRIYGDLVPIQTKFPVMSAENLTLPLPGRDINARHYQPKGEHTIPGLLIFFHGGGYVTGNIDTHDDVCRLLCQSSCLQVLSIDYRRPPEHPFPEPLNDALDSIRWAQDNASRFGISPRAIAVGGDSAGGNFAAVASLKTNFAQPLLAQLLLYPGVDWKTPYPSRTRYSRGLFLSSEESKWFYKNYLGIEEMETCQPDVSPMLGKTSKSTPPAIVVTAGFDVLRDEGKAYAEKLLLEGVETEYLCYSSQAHAFANLAAVCRESRQAVEEIGGKFGEMCQRSLECDKTAAVLS